MSTIFISYRRSDTSGHAGRLRSDLVKQFGRDALFLDVEGIGPGSDFTVKIDETISTADALLAVIGRDWLDAVNAQGERRLDDPDDLVRREIEAGLVRGKFVIPVLVAGARMPAAGDLPTALAPLARRNAIELSDERWDYDVQRLVNHLSEVCDVQCVAASQPAVEAVSTGARPWRQRRRALDVRDTGLPQRRELLERVWNQRIRNGLDRSLQVGTEMSLDLTAVPDLVRVSYHQLDVESEQPIDLLRAYQESGRQLVFVGAPGSGKTTQTLILMRHLLESARRDPSAPIPELFSLAGWRAHRKSLLDWLATQLQLRHGYPQSVGRSAVYHHHIVAILDGLDEVAPDERASCVEAINAFWSTHRGGPLVLSCRLEEYERLPECLLLGGAVRVEAPSPKEVARYLRTAGDAWEPVAEALESQSDPALARLLATPLLLSVAVLAYRHGDPRELCGWGTDGARRQALWDRYLDEMHRRRSEQLGAAPSGRGQPYDAAHVQLWLRWLSCEMRRRSATEFWLHEAVGSRRFRAGVRLVLWALLTIVCTAVFAVTAVEDAPFTESLVAGAVFGFAGAALATVRPAFRAPLQPKAMLRGMLRGLSGGVLAGAVLMTVLALAESYVSPTTRPPSAGELLRTSLSVGLVLAAAFGPVMALIAIGPDRARVAPVSPGQILVDSARIGVTAGLAVGAVIFLALTMLGGTGAREASGVGVSAAVVAGLILGLGVVVFHFAYRVQLWRQGHAPLRWVQFLTWASDHLYLRSAGAAFQWIHLELRDHLATNEPSATPARSEAVSPAPGAHL